MSGPQCCANPPSLSSSYGAGHVEELGGLKSYVVGSSDSQIAVLLVSDVFGTFYNNFIIYAVQILIWVTGCYSFLFDFD